MGNSNSLSTSTPTMQRPPYSDRALSTLVAIAGSGNAVSATERQQIEARRDLVAAALAGGQREHLAEAVLGLLRMFPRRETDDRDAAGLVAGYVMVLEPLPLWAVREAAVNWARGRGGSDAPARFSPSPAELYQAADQLCAPFRVELSKLESALATEPPALPATRPTVADLKEKFGADWGLNAGAEEQARLEAERAARGATMARANDTARAKIFAADGREYEPGSLDPSPSLLRSLADKKAEEEGQTDAA